VPGVSVSSNTGTSRRRFPTTFASEAMASSSIICVPICRRPRTGFVVNFSARQVHIRSTVLMIVPGNGTPASCPGSTCDQWAPLNEL